jgi:hypothetical protein
MSALGRFRPVKAAAGFSTWQPDMLARPAGFGQEQPFDACENVRIFTASSVPNF